MTAARALRAEVRMPDLVGRLAGDEFAVLARGVVGRRATDLANRIRESVAAEPLYSNGRGPVWLSTSVGVASLSSSPLLPAVMEEADRDL